MAQSSEARAMDIGNAGTHGAQSSREPSMEEILASIKRIIEDTDSARRPTAPETLADDVAEAEVRLPEPDNDAATVELSAFREELRPEPAPSPFAGFASAPQAAPARVEADAEPYRPAEQQVQRPAIISDHAGRQVAASFGELNDAFAASRRRSFDEIAEEMMRPMLQDWLDNNLPLLVERLVREEIERVARGGVR